MSSRTCTPKIMQLSTLVKSGQTSCMTIRQGTCRPFHSITKVLGTVDSNGRGVIGAPPLGRTYRKKVSRLITPSSLQVAGWNRVSMSSWLRSSGVLYTNGGVNGGSNNNGNGFPNNSRARTGKELGETSIFRQEGHNIEEVPVAVLRSNVTEGEKSRKGPPRSYVDLDPSEEAAFVEGFSNFHTPQQVLKMLDTIPSQEVTPFVSFSILKKLFELESNYGFRNQGRSWLNTADNSKMETFTRLAIVTRLIDTILTCQNATLLLDTLDLMRQECLHERPAEAYDSDNQVDYRQKVLQEVLIRVTEGKLELAEVCRAVVILGKMEVENGFSFGGDYVDKFWVGVLDRSDDINAENVVDVLRTVKYFKKSSRLVLNLLERKLVTLCWKMSPTTVAEICSIFLTSEGPIVSTSEKESRSINSWQVSTRLLMSLSKCTNINIHKVTERELATIVKAFDFLNFCDSTIEQALSKYMKAKSIRITESELVANVMNFVRKFRLRSQSILDATAEFTIRNNASNLSPPQLTSILRPFGELDFQPSQGPKFWEVIEAYLHQKFIQFPPKDTIALLLSCVYLKKYPINFVDRTFSPYFLDRLHTSEPDFTLLQQYRSELKLLDTALTIECKGKYSGPLLPKDFSSRTIFIDGRILRFTPVLKETIAGMYPNSSLDTNVILPGLPFNPVFTADVLLTKSKIYSELDRNTMLRSHITSYLLYTNPPTAPTHDFTIVLVHIPEHYSSDGKHLTGIQTLRKRLLKTLGLKVVSLRYQTLIEQKLDFTAFSEYIQRKFRQACTDEVEN